MSEGWGGNEKRVTKEPPKQKGGHRKGVDYAPKPKPDAPKKGR